MLFSPDRIELNAILFPSGENCGLVSSLVEEMMAVGEREGLEDFGPGRRQMLALVGASEV
jgi:hypothetical protein